MRFKRFIWDPVTDAYLGEQDETGATIATYTQEPVPYGSLISQRRGGETSYYHYDGLGSTRELISASEVVTDTNLYDAWGVNVASTGTTENPFKWRGRQGYYFDAATGDYYVRARNYQPSIGRWASADPLRFVDGPNVYIAYFIPRDVDPSGLLLGYGYGHYCGYSRAASCPPGSGKRPIDALDGACERHDCCLATIWDAWKLTCCNASLCTEAKEANRRGCDQSYPRDPKKAADCKYNASLVATLFCLL